MLYMYYSRIGIFVRYIITANIRYLGNKYYIYLAIIIFTFCLNNNDCIYGYHLDQLTNSNIGYYSELLRLYLSKHLKKVNRHSIIDFVNSKKMG